MRESKTRARLARAGALAVALLVAGLIGFLSNGTAATAATGGPDDDGTLALIFAETIPAGGVFNGIAGNLREDQVFRVMPVPLTTGCRLITSREELIEQPDNLLSLLWEVKNIGASSCVFTARMSFTT